MKTKTGAKVNLSLAVTGKREGLRPRRFFAGLAVVVFFACVASAIYFARRTSYMMTTHGITLDDTVQYDLLHLQTQFLMAVLSLCAIVWLLFMVVYRYLLYREYLGQLDELTGIMGRRIFLAYCDRRFQENAHSEHRSCAPWQSVCRPALQGLVRSGAWAATNLRFSWIVPFRPRS